MSFRDVPSRNQVDRGISRNKESALTGHRIQSGLVPAIQKSRLRLLGRALDPGVENVYLAPRWSLKWRSRSGPAVVGRDCGA
ncbi:hypothetical protein BASA83_001143 [Batrachochytrium salamandrivorans]|nr:hypothetical protein BASA83_001143 [Batrachochytrium salamandrivorans]